jgi:hypothetical protein
MSKGIYTQEKPDLLVLTLIDNGDPIPGVVVKSNPGGNRECIPKSRDISRFTPDAGGVTIEFKGLPFHTRHAAPGAPKMIAIPGQQIAQGFVGPAVENPACIKRARRGRLSVNDPGNQDV